MLAVFKRQCHPGTYTHIFLLETTVTGKESSTVRTELYGKKQNNAIKLCYDTKRCLIEFASCLSAPHPLTQHCYWHTRAVRWNEIFSIAPIVFPTAIITRLWELSWRGMKKSHANIYLFSSSKQTHHHRTRLFIAKLAYMAFHRTRTRDAMTTALSVGEWKEWGKKVEKGVVLLERFECLVSPA